MSKPNFTPLEIDFKWRTQTEKVWCKPWLTAGDQVRLAKGQKVTRAADQAGAQIEIDVGESIERQQLMVAIMRTNADGTPFYRDLRELQANEPAKKVEALGKAISEAIADPDEGNESTALSGAPSPDLH